MYTTSPQQPLASVIVTSYNYARYLRSAIDSALSQTYPHVEVVVVDDGSTDDSRQIIASYGERVVPVLKENGGHPSAVNTGFAASRGQLISFLDADDLFYPEKIALIMEAWRAMPAASVIYHQMRAIDAQGEELWDGRPWPSVVHRGDIAVRVEQSGGWWPWPTTSGLSFPRSYLDRVLPMPEEEFERGTKGAPDAYMAGVAPFVGPVVGIRRPLTSYRLHGENHSQLASATKQTRCERKLNFLVTEFSVVKRTLHVQLSIPTTMSLTDHYHYRYYRRCAMGGGVPLGAALAVTKCSLLPPPARVREAIKVLLQRY